jgi:hypothetical protein
MDVDEWMRHFANQAYFGNWDTYGFRRPKNLRMYVNPVDDKIVPLFWDCDLCNFSEPLYNRSEATSRLDEIRDIPHNFRLFWGHMWDFVDRSFNVDYVARWAAHYGEKAAGQTHGGDETFAGIANSTRSRSAQALAEIDRQIPPVDFEITTNGGNNITVDTNTVRLNGKGWVNVRQIRLQGSEVPLDAFWPEADTWQIDLPLGNNSNEFVLEAYNFRGELIASDNITVTTTMNNPALDSLRISEVNYHPASPTAAESGLGHTDGDDFEFIEFTNIGNETISLVGIELAQVRIGNNDEGVSFDFASGAITELAPGAFVLVVEDSAAFAARYGNGLPVAGQWSGGLDNGSETITVRAEGAELQQFTYDDDWYPSTDGGGSSLEIRDARASLDVWSTAAGWNPSGLKNGSPGSAGVVLGDSNHDGVFNSSDLVLVFQAAEYEDSIDNNSTFEEGDWNGDGDFTTADFVYVFQFGAYDREEPAARPAPVNDVAANDTNQRREVELLLPEVNVKQAVRSIDGVFEQFEDDDDLHLGLI